MREINLILDDAFTQAGFDFEDEMFGTAPAKAPDTLYAVPKLKKTEVSGVVTTSGRFLGREKVFTVAVRCFGEKGVYSDGNELEAAVASAEEYLLLDSDANVRWLSTGELTRDAASGRLTVTVLLELRGFEEVTEGVG